MMLVNTLSLLGEDICENENKDKTQKLESFCMSIRTGMKKKEFYNNIIEYGWYGLPDKWSIGVVYDTINGHKKKRVSRYNIESNAFANSEKTLELVVDFRRCGFDYILYQYSLIRKDNDKNIERILQKCFGNNLKVYSEKYNFECEESILNKSKQDSIADSIITNMIPKLGDF